MPSVVPGRTYFYKTNFNASKNTDKFRVRPLYDLGTIEIRRGLDSSYALIAVRNVKSPGGAAKQGQPMVGIVVGSVVRSALGTVVGASGAGHATVGTVVSKVEGPSPSIVSSKDALVVLKLLPLAKKLELLTHHHRSFLLHQSSPDSCYATDIVDTDIADTDIADMIVSDVVDEQRVFLACHTKYGGMTMDKINRFLSALPCLKVYDFHPLCRDATGKKSLLSIIIKLLVLASSYPRSLLNGRCNLEKDLRDVCYSLMKTYFPELDYAAIRKLRHEYRDSSKDRSVAHLMKILYGPSFFDTDVHFNHKYSMSATDSKLTLMQTSVAMDVDHSSIREGHFKDFRKGFSEKSASQSAPSQMSFAFFSSRCTYRTDLPKLYPNEDGVLVAKEEGPTSFELFGSLHTSLGEDDNDGGKEIDLEEEDEAWDYSETDDTAQVAR